MKVLSMAWTIYDDRLKEFCMNCTGGGLVIKNICEYIGREVESYLFIGRYQLPEMQLGNIHIVGTDIKPVYEENLLSKNEKHLKIMERAFEAAIQRIKPDIVNFHGLGDLMLICIQICRKWKIPYVYTEHLYIGFQKNIEKYNTSVAWERSLYNIPDLKIIAVSAGVKKRILLDFPTIPDTNITVIPNGTDFTVVKSDCDLLDRYSLGGKKVLLCVGTLLARKNQRQIVKAFALLPKDIKENIKVLFCGVDRLDGALQRDIKNAGFQEQLIYVGPVSSNDMKQYYSISHGLIMPSLAEGLSIAALEAITYGIPVIMFSDSECADDLNDTNVVCLAENRSDRCLVEAIVKWFYKEWDKKYIIDYSKYFSMERMAKDYILYYKKRLINLVQLGVSVVIPVYKGTQYIPSLLNMLFNNFNFLIAETGIQGEAIFINDYPEEPLEIEASWNQRMNIQVINLPVNHGIHGARTKGLAMARGRYILFLDQDDQITDNYIISQIELAGDADGVLSNGYIDRYCMDGKRIIYPDKAAQEQAISFDMFINQGNRILSPGQMLIKKSSIPTLWKDVVMRRNGADDYLLWILMLSEGKKFNINTERLYTHIGQGSNSSYDIVEMWESLREMLQLLKNNHVLQQQQLDIIKDRVDNAQKSNRLISIIALYDYWMYLKIRNKNIVEYLIKKGIKKVALYGMNYVGNRLYDELKNSEIKVIVGIDQDAEKILYEIPILKIDDIELRKYIQEVDMIIVTAVAFFREIKQKIERYYPVQVVSMRDILLKMQYDD